MDKYLNKSWQKNMGIDYVDTNIGKFNIGMPPEKFICRELPMYSEYSGNGEIIIKSCLTKVIFVLKDGKELAIEPVTMESCMKPGEKNIIPVTYTGICGMDGNVTGYEVSTPYQRVAVEGLCRYGNSMCDASYGQRESEGVAEDAYRHCEDIAGNNYRRCEDTTGNNYIHFNIEDLADVYTEDYIPHIKVNSCVVCRNCGRC